MIPIVLNFLDEMVKTTISETAITRKKEEQFLQSGKLILHFSILVRLDELLPGQTFHQQTQERSINLRTFTRYKLRTSERQIKSHFAASHSETVRKFNYYIRWLGLKVLLLFSFE